MKVYVFGDSLSAGFGIPPRSRWDALLEEEGFLIVNEGQNGDTLPHIVARLEAYNVPDGSVVYVQGGTNDCAMGVGTEALVGVLKHLVALSRNHRWQLFFGLPSRPVCLDGVFDRVLYEKISELRKAIMGIDGLYWIDFEPALFLDEENYFFDAVHPNTQGAKVIAEVLKKTLKDFAGQGPSFA